MRQTTQVAKPMALPGFKLTATGLEPNKTLSREQWEAAGETLGAIEGRLMWYVGDWLNAGEDGGYIERGKLDEACKRFGIAYGTAKNAAMVCRKVERSRRRDHLTFAHHQEVAGRDDAAELLERAETEQATVKQLREWKKDGDDEKEFDEDKAGDKLTDMLRRELSRWPESQRDVAVQWVVYVLQDFGYRGE